MESLQGGYEFSREELAIYLGTMNAIVRIIDENKRISPKKLRYLLMTEIDSVMGKLKEN